MILLSFFHILLEVSNYFSSANAISGPSVMSMRNGGGWGHFVYLNTKIPSGINSGTIIVAENNVDCWESPEMKGAWGTHMSADISNNSFHSFCFVYERQGAQPQTSLLAQNAVNTTHKTLMEFFILSCFFCVSKIFSSFKCLCCLICSRKC